MITDTLLIFKNFLFVLSCGQSRRILLIPLKRAPILQFWGVLFSTSLLDTFGLG
jgi:hypothetical protein